MIVEYDVDGRITHVVSVYPPELVTHMSEQGRIFLQLDAGASVNIESHYVDDAILRVRPMPDILIGKLEIMADGEDQATITGIPAGHRVYVDGQDMGDADGEPLVITSDMPFIYEIEVRGPWPWRNWNGLVTAVTPPA